jgi:hypothetical protein
VYHIHSIRSTTITNLLNAGVTAEDVAKQTGHIGTKMIDRYDKDSTARSLSRAAVLGPASAPATAAAASVVRAGGQYSVSPTMEQHEVVVAPATSSCPRVQQQLQQHHESQLQQHQLLVGAAGGGGGGWGSSHGIQMHQQQIQPQQPQAAASAMARLTALAGPGATFNGCTFNMG